MDSHLRICGQVRSAFDEGINRPHLHVVWHDTAFARQFAAAKHIFGIVGITEFVKGVSKCYKRKKKPPDGGVISKEQDFVAKLLV